MTTHIHDCNFIFVTYFPFRFFCDCGAGTTPNCCQLVPSATSFNSSPRTEVYEKPTSNNNSNNKRKSTATRSGGRTQRAAKRTKSLANSSSSNSTSASSSTRSRTRSQQRRNEQLDITEQQPMVKLLQNQEDS